MPALAIPRLPVRRLDGLLAFILLLPYPLWSGICGQDVSYDALNYHLYSALTFLAQAHQGDLLPGGTQTFLNPLATLPAAALYFASAWLGPLWPSLLLALLQGVVLVLVYALGLRLFAGDRPLAFLAALLGGTAPLALSEAGNTMADLTLALLSTGSLLLLLALVDQPPRSGHRLKIALAAGLAGAAVGMKLTLVFVLPLLVLLWLLTPARGPIGPIACVLSLLLFASPQLILASRYTGNPVFPLFNQHFRSPLLEDVQPSEGRFLPDSPAAFVAAPLFDFTDSFFGPFNPAMDLQTRRSEARFRDLRTLLWSCASLGLLLLPAWRRRLDLPALGLVAGLVISYLAWLGLSGIGRYAIPLQVLQGLVLGLAMQQLAPSLPLVWGRRVGPAALLAGLVLVCFATQITPNWGRVSYAVHWTRLQEEASSAAVALPQPPLVPLDQGRLRFPQQQPLVLLDRPFGWIKAHTLDSRNALLHWNPGMAPRWVGHSKLAAVQARLESQLLASGVNTLLVLTLSTEPVERQQRLQQFLAEAPRLQAAGFQSRVCSTYQGPSTLQRFSICLLAREPAS